MKEDKKRKAEAAATPPNKKVKTAATPPASPTKGRKKEEAPPVRENGLEDNVNDRSILRMFSFRTHALHSRR